MISITDTEPSRQNVAVDLLKEGKAISFVGLVISVDKDGKVSVGVPTKHGEIPSLEEGKNELKETILWMKKNLVKFRHLCSYLNNRNFEFRLGVDYGKGGFMLDLPPETKRINLEQDARRNSE